MKINVYDLGTYIGSMITLCFVIFYTVKNSLNTYLSKNNKINKTSVIIHNKIDSEIKGRLDDIREILNANSARVHTFHNGRHYLSGVSELKVTCLYEVLKYGTKPHQIHLIDMPLNLSGCLIERLIEDDIVFCEDIETCKKDENSSTNYDKTAPFRQIEREIGNEAFSAIVLKEETEVVGFVTFGYEDKKDFIINKEEMYKIRYYIENEFKRLSEIDEK